MRLTVDLEDDIVEFINQEKRRTGQTMKEIVNRALRDGYGRLESMRQTEAGTTKRELR